VVSPAHADLSELRYEIQPARQAWAADGLRQALQTRRHMSRTADVDRIDRILSEWKAIIGEDFDGYRNHVVRMATFCLMLKQCSLQEQLKIEIAACFHDIGLWTGKTLDYLAPSLPPARNYLSENGLDDWSEEIELMILQHHKVRPIGGNGLQLVELFRKGDLVDVSLGLVRFGLGKAHVRAVRNTFPNAGFHKMLLELAVRWFVKHPLNPAPMMKW
jgi:hypothetical protein